MRHLLVLLSVGFLSHSLAGAEQTITVTPANLDGWILTGADKPDPNVSNPLTLPAGAQLSRQFAGGAVIVHLVTAPIFSEDATEWPIAGVGPMALALIRKETDGQLVLVIGESKVVDLPWTIALDKKQKTSIELVFAYDPDSGNGLITLEDKAKLFEVPRSTKPTEVWLSAGEKSPWSFELLQVVRLTPDLEPSGKPDGLSRSTSGKNNPVDQLKAATDRLLAQGKAGKVAGGTADNAGSTLETAPVSTLEIFTPPSVRRAQVIQAIRSAVAGSQRK